MIAFTHVTRCYSCGEYTQTKVPVEGGGQRVDCCQACAPATAAAFARDACSQAIQERWDREEEIFSWATAGALIAVVGAILLIVLGSTAWTVAKGWLGF